MKTLFMWIIVAFDIIKKYLKPVLENAFLNRFFAFYTNRTLL